MERQAESNIVKENDAILSAQRRHLSEVAKLRRDGATEPIEREIPETATIQ